jgi:RNA polymerase sigma factor (sigma-70 family)
MNHGKLESALRDLRSVVRLPGEDGLADDELVRRYCDEREDAAFAALVRRYGPMVLRVCYRVLRRSHDAEDAFQATFLTLAREAVTLRQRGAIGAWIHEVAYHAALRVRQRLARQRHHEEKLVPPMNHQNPEEGILREDVQTVLYEELHRLPEKYRIPLVLCNLLGRTHEEAAREMNLERSALSKRLKRGYSLLRHRLLGRGVALSLVLLASLLREEGKAGPVSSELLLRTVRAMTASASGTAVASTAAALTAKGTLGWLLGFGQIPRLVFAAVVLLAGGGFWLLEATKPPPPNAPSTEASPVAAPAPLPRRVEKPSLDEWIELNGTILDAAGRPVSSASVAACGLRSFRHGKHDVRDEVLARGQTDEAGRFSLKVPRPDSTWSLRTAFVHLWAAAPGHAPTTLRLPWRPDAPPITAKLKRSETIRGLLLDESGKPAARVKIDVSHVGSIRLESIQCPGGDARRKPALWPAAVTTDAEGRFTLSNVNVEEGIGVSVCDDRYALRRAMLEPSRWSGREGTLQLSAARLLEGRVVGIDGATLPGARLCVVVRDAGRKSIGRAVEARADAGGRFRIHLPEGDSYSVEAVAPDGAPYVGIGRELRWPEQSTRQELELPLPRGVLIRGVVSDASNGKAIIGAHVQFRPLDDAVLPTETLTGANSPTLTGEDGSFRLAIPKVKGVLLIHEPSGDYIQEEWPDRLRGVSGHIRANRVLILDAASGPEVHDVGVVLRRGVRIEGRVLGPDGEPAGDGAWLCRDRTSPNNLDEGQPQPFWNGRFTLRGCVPGRVYPVLFLDPSRRLGAQVELLAEANGKPVEVRLQSCGVAEVRFVDESGQPVAGHQPFLYVMVPPDRREGEEGVAPSSAAAMHELDEFDPDHYRDGPRTDADGRVALPALIPGVRYRMSHYRDDSGAWREIETKPGQTLSLPDVVLNRR